MHQVIIAPPAGLPPAKTHALFTFYFSSSGRRRLRRVAGVGHLSCRGAGPLNKFGEDFSAAGTKWTAALCNKDSDGDGLTNGEEARGVDALLRS